MTITDDIKEICNTNLKKYRLFEQYFKEYKENNSRPQYIYSLGEDEVKYDHEYEIVHLATPNYRISDVITLLKQYRIDDWQIILNDHRYIFDNMMRKLSLEENRLLMNSLHDKVSQLSLTTSEFDNGKKAIQILNSEKRYADTIITSFTNPFLKKMNDFIIWYKYGPEVKKEKGTTFLGNLNYLDVYGVPGISNDRVFVYEKNNIGLNISPLDVHLESFVLLSLVERLNIWEIKQKSCLSITLQDD